MTSTLSPRLRVDNGYKMWKYTGELLIDVPMDVLVAAMWRPKFIGTRRSTTTNNGESELDEYIYHGIRMLLQRPVSPTGRRAIKEMTTGETQGRTQAGSTNTITTNNINNNNNNNTSAVKKAAPYRPPGAAGKSLTIDFEKNGNSNNTNGGRIGKFTVNKGIII